MSSPEAGGSEAVVARVDFGQCVLRLDDGGSLEATVRGKLMGPRKALGHTVVVGDRVGFTLEDGRAMVRGVRPRRHAFSRRASGERPEEQVVAANLDQVVLVASLREPEFRPGLADRILAQAEHAGLPARLVLNKVDLAEVAEARAILADYARAEYAGHAVCAKSGEGVPELLRACRGRRSLFVGHSGVGKSTLLNALAPGLALVAGHVNPRTGRGRHTTTAAWLHAGESSLEVIDTPGIRSFALWGISARDLEQAYLEFRRFLGGCRFGDCLHQAEPGCALRAALEAGEISRRRFESFLKLREELEREEALALTRSRRGRP